MIAIWCDDLLIKYSLGMTCAIIKYIGGEVSHDIVTWVVILAPGSGCHPTDIVQTLVYVVTASPTVGNVKSVSL